MPTLLKEKAEPVRPLHELPEYQTLQEKAQAAQQELYDVEARFQYCWTLLHPPPPSSTVPMGSPSEAAVYEAQQALPLLTDRRLRAKIALVELEEKRAKLAGEHRERVDAEYTKQIQVVLGRLLDRVEPCLEFEKELKGLIVKRQEVGGSGDLGDHPWHRLFAGIRQLRSVVSKA